MFASIVSLIEHHLGAAARLVLPAVVHEVSTLVGAAEKGEKVEFGKLAAVLEREAGQLGRSLLERIIARVTHGLGPVNAMHDQPGGLQGFDPFKPAEGAIKGLEKDILKAVHQAGDVATQAVKQAESTATAAVNAAEKTAVQAVDTAGKEAEALAKDALSAVEKGLLGVIAKEALSVAAKLARDVAPNSLDLTLGPLTVGIVDVPGAVGKLEAAASHPPTSRDGLKTLLSDLVNHNLVGNVQLKGDVALAALVVESDSLSAGFVATWDASTFIARFDAAMDAVGLR